MIVVTTQIRMNEEGVAVAIEEIEGAETADFFRHIGNHLKAPGQRGNPVIPERGKLIEKIAEGMLAICRPHGSKARAYQGQGGFKMLKAAVMGKDMGPSIGLALERVGILINILSLCCIADMGKDGMAAYLVFLDKFDPGAIEGGFRLLDQECIGILLKADAPAGFVGMAETPMPGKLTQRIRQGYWIAAGNRK